MRSNKKYKNVRNCSKTNKFGFDVHKNSVSYTHLDVYKRQALGACIYLINEMTGRKIMRMAIGPIAAIATGVILNLTYLIGLTPLV